MTSVAKTVNALATILERILAIALLIGIALNFVNVLGRYFFSFALNGADEIEIYILIWIAFLGAATVTWRGMHLRMDVLINACPAPVRLAAALFEAIVFVSVAGFVAWQSFNYFQRIFALGAISDIAHIPTWIAHIAIPISFGLMALAVLLRTAQRLMGASAGQEAFSQGGPP